MHTILAFGDSITWGAWDPEGGWVARLRKELDPSQDWLVYNLGIDGDTSRGVLERFECETRPRLRHLEPGERLVIIFAIGTNDSQIQMATGENKIPIDEFKSNLEKLAKMAGKLTDKILFVGLTCVDESRSLPVEWDSSIGYSNEQMKRYELAIQKVCERVGIKFLPVFDEFGELDNPWDDGLHPNARGHEFLARKVLETIKPWLL